MIHYYLHHGTPIAETYLYDMKRYHNYHHFSHHEQGKNEMRILFIMNIKW